MLNRCVQLKCVWLKCCDALPQLNSEGLSLSQTLQSGENSYAHVESMLRKLQGYSEQCSFAETVQRNDDYGKLLFFLHCLAWVGLLACLVCLSLYLFSRGGVSSVKRFVFGDFYKCSPLASRREFLVGPPARNISMGRVQIASGV